MRRFLVGALIVVVLAAGAVVATQWAGNKQPAAKAQRARGEAGELVPAPATPREAVEQYLAALTRKDYQAAYALLSAESQQAHPLAEFSQQARTGMTSFDVSGATEGPEEDGRVVVSVPLLEDPAQAGFTTVKEGAGWKVVYLSGVPWFPYPEPAPHE